MISRRQICEERFEIKSFPDVAFWYSGFTSRVKRPISEMINAGRTVVVCDGTVSLLGSQRRFVAV